MHRVALSIPPPSPHQDPQILLSSICPLHQHVKESTLHKAKGGYSSVIRKQLSEDTIGPTEISVALKPVLSSPQVKGTSVGVSGLDRKSVV